MGVTGDPARDTAGDERLDQFGRSHLVPRQVLVKVRRLASLARDDEAVVPETRSEEHQQ
jgi:hypothetical protein